MPNTLLTATAVIVLFLGLLALALPLWLVAGPTPAPVRRTKTEGIPVQPIRGHRSGRM